MAVYSFTREPKDDVYQKLIDYALPYCENIVLVIRPSLPMSPAVSDVLNRLAPFLVEAIETSEWPGTKLLDETARVYRYKFTFESAPILKQAAPSLYGWTQPQLPEDLCLMRADGSPWLVSIAHEMDGYLELSVEEKNNLLVALPEIAPLEEG